MKEKAKIVVIPKIIVKKVINCLTDDNMLDGLANIMREFLHAAWLIDHNASYFANLKKQNLIDPISQLLTSKLNLPKENIQDICEHIIEPFLDPEFAEILIGEIVLKKYITSSKLMKNINAAYFVRKKNPNQSDFVAGAFGKFLMETTDETECALKKLNSWYPSYYNYNKTLRSLIDKRRAHIKNYYLYEFDEGRAASQSILLKRNFLRIFAAQFVFMTTAILVFIFVSLASFIFNYKLTKSHIGLIFLAALTATVIQRIGLDKINPLVSQSRHPHENYLINQIISKEILKRINIFYPEENKKIPIQKQPQRISTKIIQKENRQQNGIDAVKVPFLESNNKEIIMQKEKKSKKELQQTKISKKIKEIDKRLVNHKNTHGNINPEIIWKYEKNNKFIEKIYHPLRDMFKIIELWTLNPSKQMLNNQHYMVWHEANIRKLLGKKIQLYSDFSRIGKIGRIANSEDEQGYVSCEGYEKHPWKIKSLNRESGAYRMFFTPVSTTKRESDSKDVTLYEAVEFRKTH